MQKTIRAEQITKKQSYQSHRFFWPELVVQRSEKASPFSFWSSSWDFWPFVLRAGGALADGNLYLCISGTYHMPIGVYLK